MCVNAVTRSAVTVEIKKPSTPLMEEKSYRGSATAEVFPPHRELSRAVSQVHAQMESVPRDMPPTPALGDIDQWHVRGAVIIGRVAELGDEQRDSFLRYREGLTGVTVLGYDEVGERLKSLRDMLADPAAPPRLENYAPVLNSGSVASPAERQEARTTVTPARSATLDVLVEGAGWDGACRAGYADSEGGCRCCVAGWA